MAIKLVISGATGKMGQTLVRLAGEGPEFSLVGGIDKHTLDSDEAARHGLPAINSASDAGPLISAADVLLDFSAPAGLQTLLQQCGLDLAGTAVVIGTTGLTPEIDDMLEQLSGRCALVVAANFSVAVNLMIELSTTAARVLHGDSYDVEIVEAHHKRKADAPSGTALALAKAIAQARGVELDKVRTDGRSGSTGARPAGQIGIHALRGGDVVGEHQVHFIGARDRFEITHRAQDRALFADGALLATRWIHGKPPGRYTMKDVLGIGA